MTEDEIEEMAWHEVLTGAESYLEDDMDEDGDYSEEDWDRIMDKAWNILSSLQQGIMP